MEIKAKFKCCNQEIVFEENQIITCILDSVSKEVEIEILCPLCGDTLKRMKIPLPKEIKLMNV